MPSLYALIVGIDKYDPASTIAIPQLFGCVNDAAAFRGFIEQRYSSADSSILSLTNEQATRANVVSGFIDHLSKAQAGDTAVFYYAGHGSEQDPTPDAPLLSGRKPDDKHQTKVLYDSRTAGGHDLIDDDMIQLLGGITARGVHMTVVLDCCHSGSSTRGIVLATRSAPGRDTPPMAAPPLPLPTLPATSKQGVHIAFEACADTELANEYPGPGDEPRGAFTLFLLQQLQAMAQLPSYTYLMQCVSPHLTVLGQTPQLEQVNSEQDVLDFVFLGAQPAPPVEGILLRPNSLHKTWQLDAGTTLSFSVGDSFAIYPPNLSGPALHDPAQALTSATISTLTPNVSTLTPADPSKLDPNFTLVYTAMLTSRAARIGVSFMGDAVGQTLLRSAAASLYLKEDNVAPRLTVTSIESQFSFGAPLLHGILPGPVPVSPDNAVRVIAALEHMAQWITRLELQPSLSALPSAFIELSVTQCGLPGKPTTDYTDFANIELPYIAAADGNLHPPTITVRVTNKSTQTLYIALLAFDSSWQILPSLLPAGAQKLDPAESVVSLAGQPCPMIVNLPAIESHDDILLIASTNPIDGYDFKLGPLSDVIQGTRDFAVPAPTAFKNSFLTRRLHLHTTSTPKLPPNSIPG